MDIDYILTFEAMGIHIGMVLSIKSDTPLIIGRKRRYIDEVIEVNREDDTIYIPEIIKSSRIVIVDSIISTGETILNTIMELRRYDVDIKGIYVVIDRVDQGGVQRILDATGLEVYTMVRIWVDEDGLRLVGD
jgi:adenine phosphoribosyltransferase